MIIDDSVLTGCSSSAKAVSLIVISIG